MCGKGGCLGRCPSPRFGLLVHMTCVLVAKDELLLMRHLIKEFLSHLGQLVKTLVDFVLVEAY